MAYTHLNEQLNALIRDISKCLKTPFEEELRTWLMAAVLRIWAGNKLCAEEYIHVLPVLKEQEYTTAQVITALDCAGDENRSLQLPKFFKELVQFDAPRRSSHSRTIADQIGRLLAEFALVNGDFTIEEASALRQISELLIGYCDKQCIVTGTTREYHPEWITPLSNEGYYLSEEKVNNSVQNQARKEENKEEPPKEEPPKEEPPQHITVNLNFTPDDINGNSTNTIVDQNESQSNLGLTVKKPNTEAEDTDTLESVMAELHSLVGLDKVKNDVQSLMNFVQICKLRTERGMKVPTISYHLVFTGNPGTGKTTVARLVAKLYYLMGILPQGQLVETDRSGLVAGYLGQTAIKTQKVIQEALGGVLFIDEAYALANDKEDSYGKEAIETILKAMEDHRDELVVIVAGYDELMHQFIDSNPGLRSRFNKYFHFPDYCGEELYRIFLSFCNKNGYILAEDAGVQLRGKLDDMFAHREEHFGNARAVRNLFENAIHHQANRLIQDSDVTDVELMELNIDDILLAMEAI